MELKIEKVEGQTLTVYTGQALAPRLPLNVYYTGNIFSPIEFWEKRNAVYKEKVKDCHVEINKETMVIKLITDETSPDLKNEIVGKLEFNSDYQKFYINSDNKTWQPEELAKFVKLNKYFFDDPVKQTELVNALHNIKGKATTEFEKYDNRRGDIKSIKEQFVKHNIPQGFMLKMEVLKGIDPIKFWVDIELDYSDSQFFLYLLSSEMKEMVEQIKAQTIEEIVNRFGEEIAILYS